MSWSVSLGATPASEFEVAVDALSTPETQTANAIVETQQQLLVAKELAKEAFRSGRLGDPSVGYFGANLGGHANPRHEPQPGWSGDSLYITVYRLDA